MVDVDEFDKVVGDALDSVEAFTEQDEGSSWGGRRADSKAC